MPRCICHITLDIAKLDFKLTQLRTVEIEQGEQAIEEVVEKESRAERSLGGLLEGGGLTHTDGGIKSSREGSSLPHEPAGILDAEKEGKPPELLEKMQKMMKKADKETEARKSKKQQAKMRKEESKKKVDMKHAKETRSIKDMLNH